MTLTSVEYSKTTAPWGGGTIIYQADRFAIIAQTVTASDKIELMIVFSSAGIEPDSNNDPARKNYQHDNRHLFSFFTMQPVAPDKVKEISSSMQKVVLRLLELEKGGWSIASEVYRKELLDEYGHSDYFSIGEVVSPSGKQKVYGHNPHAQRLPSVRRSKRALNTLTKKLEALSTDPNGIQSVKAGKPARKNKVLLDEVMDHLKDKERVHLPNIAVELMPDIEALDIVRCEEEAQKLLAQGFTGGPIRAIEEAQKRIESGQKQLSSGQS